MKVPMQVKTIEVLEWYTEEKGGVYLNWKLPYGEIIKRLTPYKETPIVVIKQPIEMYDRSNK